MSRRILIIDDDIAVIRVMDGHLSSAGYQVRMTTSPDEVFDVLSTFPADLILLDIEMPNADGRDVLTGLKRSEAYADVPVIMVTAHTGDDLLVSCLDHGAADFLNKPVTKAVLRARVQSALATADALRSANTLTERAESHAAELATLNEQLESEVLARKSAQAELSRSNESLATFAYAASHDLQEPLRMVRSFLQLLDRRYGDQLPDKGKEFLNFAVDGAARMSTLIKDLLDYSRIGTQDTKSEELDLAVPLEHAIANLHTAIEEADANIICGEMPTVEGYPSELTRLLQNIIGNAIKFRREEPLTIRIEAHREGGNWVISLEDNGIGIDQKYLKDVFVVFRRLESRKVYPGTGIGLAVCDKIARRHGGKIWVESELGVGTKFLFTLPCIDTSGSAID